jgi:hypothetical protein
LWGLLYGECGQDADNLISSNEFWPVEARLKSIHETDSAQRGSGIEILTENGSQPIRFGSSPQLCVPKTKLMIIDGASGGQDHLGCYVENGPHLHMTPIRTVLFGPVEASAGAGEELREHLRAYGADAMLFEELQSRRLD